LYPKAALVAPVGLRSTIRVSRELDMTDDGVIADTRCKQEYEFAEIVRHLPFTRGHLAERVGPIPCFHQLALEVPSLVCGLGRVRFCFCELQAAKLKVLGKALQLIRERPDAGFGCRQVLLERSNLC